MAKILVTGASGLLGCALVPSLRAQGEQVFTHGWQGLADFRVDLRDKNTTWAMLGAVCPDVIINLAALTNVDTCETQPALAYALNVKTVENLSSWMKQNNTTAQQACYLIQISSDQVYDAQNELNGGAHGPFPEEAASVYNTYGFSKIAAELAALQVSACALRTNFFGKSARAGRQSFSDWLHQSLHAGQSIQVFEDVLFSPLGMPSLVQAIAKIVQAKPQGVFNLGSHKGMSKADFAFAFAEAAGLPTASMTRASSSTSNKIQAYRPKDMRMDSRHIEQVLGISLPSLLEEIQQCGREYRETA